MIIPAYLKHHALWIIMDPWEKHPSIDDIRLCPDLDAENLMLAERIAKYTKDVPHVLVSCDQKHPVTPLLSHYTNICYHAHDICAYMDKHGFNDIVYVGFHHGRCILKRPTGAQSKKLQKYRRWVLRDLVGVLCFDDPEEQDNKTKDHATLIFSQ